MNRDSAAESATPNRRVRADMLLARLERLQAFETWCARMLGGWLPGIRRPPEEDRDTNVLFQVFNYTQEMQAGDNESAEAVQFDTMDETLHVRLGQKWVPRLMEKFGYAGALDDLVAECRRILVENTVNPLQKRSALEAKSA